MMMLYGFLNPGLQPHSTWSIWNYLPPTNVAAVSEHEAFTVLLSTRNASLTAAKHLTMRQTSLTDKRNPQWVMHYLGATVMGELSREQKFSAVFAQTLKRWLITNRAGDTCIHRLICAAIHQKLTQHCKAIMFQEINMCEYFPKTWATVLPFWCNFLYFSLGSSWQ